MNTKIQLVITTNNGLKKFGFLEGVKHGTIF